jgi:hypothetical protein
MCGTASPQSEKRQQMKVAKRAYSEELLCLQSSKKLTK